MKTLLAVFAIVGLLLTCIPAFLFFAGIMDHDNVLAWMNGGMVLWFACRIPSILAK